LISLISGNIVRSIVPPRSASGIPCENKTVLIAMPRAERCRFPEGAYLLSAYGNNRQQVFLEPADYLRFQERIGHFAARVGARVHHYVLLPAEVHVLATLESGGAPEALMRRLSLSHARWFNRKYGRRGHLWHDRYRCVVVQPGGPLLDCGLALERLPLDGRLVARLRDYPWSSAPALGWGRAGIVTPTAAYRGLARSAASRRERYRARLAEKPAVAADVLLAARIVGDADFARAVRRAKPRRAGASSPPATRSRIETSHDV
jgi:putative transposase